MLRTYQPKKLQRKKEHGFGKNDMDFRPERSGLKVFVPKQYGEVFR